MLPAVGVVLILHGSIRAAVERGTPPGVNEAAV